MKRFIQLFILNLFVITSSLAQSDNEKQALAISKADDANTQKLKAYIWKRKSDVAVDGQVHLKLVVKAHPRLVPRRGESFTISCMSSHDPQKVDTVRVKAVRQR